MTIAKFFIGFKFFTAALGKLLGSLLTVGGIIFFPTPSISITMFISGMVIYIMGRSLESMLEEEERKRKYFEDQGD